jgi:hypothetical protein
LNRPDCGGCECDCEDEEGRSNHPGRRTRKKRCKRIISFCSNECDMVVPGL